MIKSSAPPISLRPTNTIPTAPGGTPMFYFGANNGPHPDLLRDANAFWGAGMGTGAAQVYHLRRPMLMQLDYQWAGTYPKRIWDPLTYYRGYPAAPVLSPGREGVYMRAVPTHNEVGYQNVLLRDNGVPLGGLPDSTPQYAFSGPIQTGYMDFIRPIMRREQLPSIAPASWKIAATENQETFWPWGRGPYQDRPLQPPGMVVDRMGIQGSWPMYEYQAVLPPSLPPADSGEVPMRANDNPGRLRNPAPLERNTMIRNWTSPNQIARHTMANPCMMPRANPMPGSGPDYNGMMSTALMVGSPTGYIPRGLPECIQQAMADGASYDEAFGRCSRQPNAAATQQPRWGLPQLPYGWVWDPCTRKGAPPNAIPGPNDGAGCAPGTKLTCYHGKPSCQPVDSQEHRAAATTGRTSRVMAAFANPGRPVLARVQVARKPGLLERLFGKKTARGCPPSRPVSCEVVPGVPKCYPEGTKCAGAQLNPGRSRAPVHNPGQSPLGTYRGWSGQQHRATIAKAINPDACCDGCALGHGCEGGGPKANPGGCGCGGPMGNPCSCNGGAQTVIPSAIQNPCAMAARLR